MRVLYKETDGELTLQEVECMYWDTEDNCFTLFSSTLCNMICKDLSLKYEADELLHKALVDGFVDLSRYVFDVDPDDVEDCDDCDDGDDGDDGEEM